MSKPWLAAHWAKRLLREPPTPAAVPLVDVLTAPETTLVDLVLGIPGAASRVLGLHGLLELGRLSPHAIAQRTELGLHDAQRLLAALELGRRLHAARSRRPRRLRSPRDIARFFEPNIFLPMATPPHHGSCCPWQRSGARTPAVSLPCPRSGDSLVPHAAKKKRSTTIFTRLAPHASKRLSFDARRRDDASARVFSSIRDGP